MNSNKLCNYSKFLLEYKNLINKDDKLIIKKFSIYINMVIYNIVTLSCIIAILLFNTNKLNNNILDITKNHIDKICKNKKVTNMKGGTTVLPMSYYGKDDSHLYNSAESENFNNIQWENGLIRGQLGGCTKTNCSFNKQILIIINNILKEHKIKSDKHIKQKLANIIKMSLYSVVNILKLKMKNKKLKLKNMVSLLMKTKMKKLLI